MVCSQTCVEHVECCVTHNTQKRNICIWVHMARTKKAPKEMQVLPIDNLLIGNLAARTITPATAIASIAQGWNRPVFNSLRPELSLFTDSIHARRAFSSQRSAHKVIPIYPMHSIRHTIMIFGARFWSGILQARFDRATSMHDSRGTSTREKPLCSYDCSEGMNAYLPHV